MQLLALDIAAQGVDQHSGCGYVLDVHMARRLDMVVMDMHVDIVEYCCAGGPRGRFGCGISEYAKTTPSFQYDTER